MAFLQSKIYYKAPLILRDNESPSPLRDNEMKSNWTVRYSITLKHMLKAEFSTLLHWYWRMAVR